MNYDLKTISKNLKDYRKQNGLTQEDLAEELNYSVKAVSSWEQGVSTPPLDILITISKKMGIPLEDFVGVKEESLLNFIPKNIIKDFYNDNNQIIKFGKEFDKLKLDEGEFFAKINIILEGWSDPPSLKIVEDVVVIKPQVGLVDTFTKLKFYKMLNKCNLVKLENNELQIEKNVALCILRNRKQNNSLDIYYDYIEKVKADEEKKADEADAKVDIFIKKLEENIKKADEETEQTIKDIIKTLSIMQGDKNA